MLIYVVFVGVYFKVYILINLIMYYIVWGPKRLQNGKNKPNKCPTCLLSKHKSSCVRFIPDASQWPFGFEFIYFSVSFFIFHVEDKSLLQYLTPDL